MAIATNTTRSSKFNLSHIMTHAWEMYHNTRHESARLYIASGFKANRFHNCMKSAWSEARQATQGGVAL